LQDLIRDDLGAAFYDALWSSEFGSIKVTTDRKGISELAIPDCFGFAAEKVNRKNDSFRLEISFRGFPYEFGFQKQFDYQVAFFCLGKFRVSGKPAG
jgi:hypothetical protein